MNKIISAILVLVCAICLASCAVKADNNGLMGLDEVSVLISAEGYTEETFQEDLSGRDREEIIRLWGDPDEMLSGLWGDSWYLDDESHKQITLYYDKDGLVEVVKIFEGAE